MAELAPRHTFEIEMAIQDVKNEDDRFDELSSRLGDRLEFDRHALRTLLDAAPNDAGRLDVKGRLCALDANDCDSFGWELVDAGRPGEAAAAFQKMVDRAPNRVGVCNEASWLVNYYFDQKRAPEAIQIADMVAEVYCSWGLQTKADLLERMGRFDQAEELHRANHERYGTKGNISYSTLGLYYRRARVDGNARYESRFQDLLGRVFPQGLEPLPPEMDEGPPSGGVLIDGDSYTLKKAGIRGGDVIVGLDGFRVHSLEQYDAIKAFRPRTGGARDAKIRVFRQNTYLDAEVDSRNRRLYVNVRALGTPGPSVTER
jgi:tetratricopeptide (TPR) repeat protein